MNTDETEKYILDYFQAHAIKGDLKPGRIYDVIEKSPTRLRIRSRGKTGTWRQNLLIDLVTCKSMVHGEFRRANIFWQWKRKDEKSFSKPTPTNGGLDAAPDPIAIALGFDEFDSNGLPLEVDRFIERGPEKLHVNNDSKET